MHNVLGEFFADPLLWISLIVQFLLIVWGAVVALADVWAKQHRWLALSVFAILGLVGMVTTARQATKSAQDGSNLSNALTDLGTSTKEITRMTSLNTDLQGKLLTQGQTIADLAQENISSVIGGNSFCYIAFDGILDTGASVVVVSQGKYPLYDVDVRIVDAQLLMNGKDSAEYNIATKVIGDLAQPVAMQIGSIPFKTSGDRQQLNIFFHGRNGFWQQLLRLRKVGGQWREASIVDETPDPKRFPKGAILMRRVDKQFPPEELLKDKDWENANKLPRAF